MKKSVLFIISFVFITVIGTITHEIGHIIPAKILGYNTTLHYGSMGWDSQYLQYSNQLCREYSDMERVPQIELNALNELKLKEKQDKLWIALGGPIQTMTSGIVGIFILYLRRKTWNKIPFGLINWLAVFMGLFWSRQIFNLLIGGIEYFLGKTNFPFGGDEATISNLLKIPTGTIGVVTGIIGIIVCSIIVFKIVPRRDRWLFITSGVLGSVFGFFFWFELIGPKILPF